MDRKFWRKLFITTILTIFLVAGLASCANKDSLKQPDASKPKTADVGGKDPKTTAGNDKNGEKQTESVADKGEAVIKNQDKKRVKAKGLYLTATSAGARLDYYLNLANTTEINAYVIDFKNDYGTVTYASQVPLAKELGAIDVRFNPEKVIKKLKENNIYVIARIVCFKDPILSKKKPEWAIKNKSGELYVHNKMTWVSAFNKNVWDYNLDLAKEALKLGVDEVQFDYIRFPDGKDTNMVFNEEGVKRTESGRVANKVETINSWLEYARKHLPDAIISGDIFAIVLESPGDTEGIGQEFETVGKHLDYVSPMAYPSHYARGQIINKVKFPKPDLDPYGVVLNTLLKGKSRLEKVQGHKPIIRPYIQDFTASWIGAGNWQKYGPTQLRQQIQAIYDAGYDEWLVWDFNNSYSIDAFKKE